MCHIIFDQDYVQSCIHEVALSPPSLFNVSPPKILPHNCKIDVYAKFPLIWYDQGEGCFPFSLHFFENESCPGVNFINTKCRNSKRQIMMFKCQKWHLTFMKFHKTLLAYKMPKSNIFITNIGILNAKNKAF